MGGIILFFLILAAIGWMETWSPSVWKNIGLVIAGLLSLLVLITIIDMRKTKREIDALKRLGYADAKGFDGELAPVAIRKDGMLLWGLVNRAGKEIVKPAYADISYYEDDKGTWECKKYGSEQKDCYTKWGTYKIPENTQVLQNRLAESAYDHYADDHMQYDIHEQSEANYEKMQDEESEGEECGLMQEVAGLLFLRYALEHIDETHETMDDED